MPEFHVLFIGGFIALIVFGIGFAIYAERRRRQALEQFALDNGYELDPSIKRPDDLPFKYLWLFNRGRSRRIKSFMRSTANAPGGGERMVFDFRYTTGSGKNSSTHTMTVLAYHLPNCKMPAFSLRKEHFGHTIASWFGADDIDFPDYPEFSKQYHLDRSFAKGLRADDDGALIEFLQQGTVVTAETDGQYLIIWKHGKRIKVKDLPAAIAEADVIAEAFSLQPAV